MMTPQELLRKKSASINVIFHKFVLISSKLGQSVLYCFFEGNDDGSYYISRINKFFNSTEPIVCRGKENVIGIFHKLNQKDKPDVYKKAFFIDRDFDEPQNVEGIYETPTYSIENLYCSENCLRKILQNEFHLNSTDSEFEQCIIFYNDRKREFHNAVLLFNAWYYSKKRSGDCNVSLDNRFPKQFINWDLVNGITACYDKADIENLFPDEAKIDDEYLQRNMDFLAGQELTRVLRGKYELELLTRVLRFLTEDANNKRQRTILNTKVNFNFQDGRVLSQLSQYADNLECLDTYLFRLTQ